MPKPLAPVDLHDSIEPYVRRETLRLRPDETVAHALAAARASGAPGDITMFFVVDPDGRLAGSVPAQALLRSELDRPVAAIMDPDVVAIPDWATVLVAAEYFVSRPRPAFPVVDPRGTLVGQVDRDVFTPDVLALARRSFEDIYQIIGIHASEGRTAWTAFRDRFPWLLANIAGGLLAAGLAAFYEGLLAAVVVLALFIPIVLALAESVSIQSVTLALQNLHGGRPTREFLVRAVRREMRTAALLGLACGLLVGGAAWGWRGSWRLGAAIGGAIAASVVTAGVLGLVLPAALHLFRRDPKIAAGPIVLAATDVLTLVCYFNLAGWLLGRAGP